LRIKRVRFVFEDDRRSSVAFVRFELGAVIVRAAADHELDEDEVVQAQVRGDVPAVHVHLPLLPRVSALYICSVSEVVPLYQIRIN